MDNKKLIVLVNNFKREGYTDSTGYNESAAYIVLVDFIESLYINDNTNGRNAAIACRFAQAKTGSFTY